MRDERQFASWFTRWAYYETSPEKYLADIDACMYRMRDRCLRIFEWKHRFERLSNGQRTMLPLLDQVLSATEKDGLIRSGSGVYVVRGLPPFTNGAEIGQPWPPRARKCWIDQAMLIALVDLEPVEFIWKTARW
jgi:hypothetical protein